MKIDITQVPVQISSCFERKYIDRTEQVEKMLETLGFSTFSALYGRKTTPYQRGANENAKNILRSSHVPFIFMEDDAEVLLRNFYPVLDIPEDTDILYLGGALHANKNIEESLLESDSSLILNNAYGFTESRLVYKNINSEFVRIYNMYSAHAILFITEKGRDTFYNELVRKSAYPFDVVFSYIMKDLNVYMVRKPFFYQNDGHNNEFTKEVIFDKVIIKDAILYTNPLYKKPKSEWEKEYSLSKKLKTLLCQMLNKLKKH